jgi:hypothetical protein
VNPSAISGSSQVWTKRAQAKGKLAEVERAETVAMAAAGVLGAAEDGVGLRAPLAPKSL